MKDIVKTDNETDSEERKDSTEHTAVASEAHLSKLSRRGWPIGPQGAVGEASVEQAGYTNLNRYWRPEGKFPIYDVSDGQTIASVKTKDIEGLRDATIARYEADLQDAMGRGTDLGKFDKAADGLIQAARAGADVPSEVRAAAERWAPDSSDPQLASRQEVQRYLSDHSVLLIPSDHVEPVRMQIRERLLPSDNSPEAKLTQKIAASNYGLDFNAADYAVKVQSLLERVQPLPITSQEIAKELSLRNHYAR